jgi:hypothetical protein
MSRNKEPAFYERAFLNDEGDARIEFSVREADFSEHGSSLDTSFSIADCSRNVDLDFTCYTETTQKKSDNAEEIQRVRDKFARLQRAVKAFGVALNDQLDRMERNL